MKQLAFSINPITVKRSDPDIGSPPNDGNRWKRPRRWHDVLNATALVYATLDGWRYCRVHEVERYQRSLNVSRVLVMDLETGAGIYIDRLHQLRIGR